MIRTALHICLAVIALMLSATASFSLPNCPSDQTKRYHNCFGTYFGTNNHSGYKYVGEWRDDKQHGQATAIWSAPHASAGEKYVGQYKDGNPNGQGTYTWANGDKYVGEFKDNK